MRMLLCAIIALTVHLLIFEWEPTKAVLPTLAISLEPKNIDLQIKTRVLQKKTAFTPPREEKKLRPKPKPTAKPAANIISKPVSTKKKAPRLPVKKVEPKKLQEPQQQERVKSNYTSEALRKPRLIENAEYLSNPAPEYPKQARIRRQMGTVSLIVDIDSNGSVVQLKIQTSSGYSSLDKAAKVAVSKWQFTPATIEGKQISSKVLVPINFRLNT